MTKIWCAAICVSVIVNGCSDVKKNNIGEKYFTDLQKTLSKDFGYDFKDSKTTVFYILYFDSLCSCNGKYTQLVAQIINSNGNFEHLVLLKNDVKHVLENSLNNGYVAFLHDTTKALERNGHMFRYDKLFVIENQKYVNMFDLDDKSIRKVKRFFDL